MNESSVTETWLVFGLDYPKQKFSEAIEDALEIYRARVGCVPRQILVPMGALASCAPYVVRESPLVASNTIRLGPVPAGRK